MHFFAFFFPRHPSRALGVCPYGVSMEARRGLKFVMFCRKMPEKSKGPKHAGAFIGVAFRPNGATGKFTPFFACSGGCAKTTIGQKGFRRTHQSNGPPLPSGPLGVDAIQSPGCPGVTHAIQAPGCPGCRCPCYDGEGKRGRSFSAFCPVKAFRARGGQTLGPRRCVQSGATLGQFVKVFSFPRLPGPWVSMPSRAFTPCYAKTYNQIGVQKSAFSVPLPG